MCLIDGLCNPSFIRLTRDFAGRFAGASLASVAWTPALAHRCLSAQPCRRADFLGLIHACLFVCNGVQASVPSAWCIALLSWLGLPMLRIVPCMPCCLSWDMNCDHEIDPGALCLHGSSFAGHFRWPWVLISCSQLIMANATSHGDLTGTEADGTFGSYTGICLLRQHDWDVASAKWWSPAARCTDNLFWVLMRLGSIPLWRIWIIALARWAFYLAVLAFWTGKNVAHLLPFKVPPFYGHFGRLMFARGWIVLYCVAGFWWRMRRFLFRP